MPPPPLPTYHRCLRCGYIWSARPSPFACPQCGRDSITSGPPPAPPFGQRDAWLLTLIILLVLLCPFLLCTGLFVLSRY